MFVMVPVRLYIWSIAFICGAVALFLGPFGIFNSWKHLNENSTDKCRRYRNTSGN